MPTAKEFFDSGQLRGAIEALTQEVKSNPGDTQRRTFLFELLCFAGEWDRAEKQVDVIAQQSPQAALGVAAYKGNLAAERERRRLFADGAAPHFLNEPPAYVDGQVEAINALAHGDPSRARELLDRAEEDRPALTGKWNGKPFLDFRDYDDRVGGVLELVVKDRYAWLPFEQVRRIEIPKPSKLRDLLWIPARIEAADGTIGEVFLLALYALSGEEENDLVRLGRMTDWKTVQEDLYVGYGQRLFLVDDADQPVLEARTIEFDAAPEAKTRES